VVREDNAKVARIVVGLYNENKIHLASLVQLFSRSWVYIENLSSTGECTEGAQAEEPNFSLNKLLFSFSFSFQETKSQGKNYK
jgi:hypothetical protein